MAPPSLAPFSVSQMESEILKQQLAQMINSMFQEGYLDEQFHELQSLQEKGRPGFVMEMLILFNINSEKIFNQLNKLLAEVEVDFRKVDAYVHQFMGSSATIGVPIMKDVCNKFCEVCNLNDKEGCLIALREIKDEYLHLRGKIETMIELEQKIQAYEEKGEK